MQSVWCPGRGGSPATIIPPMPRAVAEKGLESQKHSQSREDSKDVKSWFCARKELAHLNNRGLKTAFA